ncbi:hypothetical protein URH17368_1174 [Alicyclobacillus hesperidum URH17-3-68]|uniref:DUF402 domain-containing protein n=1 Tax=Alicyclobacillus hesperidum TaxID=89784 RepID=A0A1H2WAW2_9BACL|nr:DUF402 domain-containing protein [Alicyclobacillus hesperidum]EJY56169.1 hypothetical protein URH17368_1174 [Alicyclobacillus hesperidum URH17-3-68]GLV14538.1 hypothetical protein Heshes_22220 [Alicyclobacillus hesperidum]SDW77691.1 hypothetical protein SAMN04489725_11437 [Alicyclobacillus hesperidum]
MRFISLRYDGQLHRVWQRVEKVNIPGCYFIPAGATVRERDGTTWSSDYPVAALFWPGVFYQVFVLLKPEVTDYYANVITPAIFGTDVVFIDLDLDVRVESHRVSLVDMDEFTRRSHLYPQSWRGEAMAAAERLFAMAKKGSGPFRPALAAALRAKLCV